MADPEHFNQRCEGFLPGLLGIRMLGVQPGRVRAERDLHARLPSTVSVGATPTSPRLVICNGKQESCNDCAWTDELVVLSSGDLQLADEPFGTYVAACYPESERPAQFIINVLDDAGHPILSLPCEYVPHSADAVRPMRPEDSPWSEDGVLIGPIPTESEWSVYTRVADALAVARELVLVEPHLVALAR